MKGVFLVMGGFLIVLGGFSGIVLFFRAAGGKLKEEKDTLWDLFILGVASGLVLLLVAFKW